MKISTLTGLLTLTVATAAFAQNPPTTIQTGGPGAAPAAAPAPGGAPVGGPGGPGGHPPHELKGDTNHDGFISRDEWRAHGDQMFDEIDLNHDGKISPEEMHAHHEKERLEHEHGGPGGQGGPGGAPAGGPAGGKAPVPSAH